MRSSHEIGIDSRRPPLVSAAITTYNRALYLPDAIESVLGQTVSDLELIVIDDGSTDDTQAVIGAYGDRIRYVRQENAGRAAARNAAVQLAHGHLIGFCDSDDRWCPDRLERQLEALARAPSVGMVHGHVELIDGTGQPLPADRVTAHRAVFAAAHRRPVTYAGYASECRCLSSTILVRRQVFDRVGLYDETLPIEDYDLYLRLLLEFDVLFLDWPPLAQYRVHGGQIAGEQLGLGQIRTAEKHLALLRDRDVPQARLARRNFHLMIARSWRVLGDRRRALAALVRALAATPAARLSSRNAS